MPIQLVGIVMSSKISVYTLKINRFLKINQWVIALGHPEDLKMVK